jgi:hypothetical protein
MMRPLSMMRLRRQLAGVKRACDVDGEDGFDLPVGRVFEGVSGATAALLTRILILPNASLARSNRASNCSRRLIADPGRGAGDDRDRVCERLRVQPSALATQTTSAG